MRYIKIETNSNGSHNNQSGGGHPGEGWIIIPEEIKIPETFPFVNIVIENDELVSMTEGEVPPIPEPELRVTEIEQMRADIDFIMAMEGYI